MSLIINDLAPIALFAYNRPIHTLATLNALKTNIHANKSELIIFSDGPKSEKDKQNVDEVRMLLKQTEGFKTIKIIFQEKNIGLANSIITGVTFLLQKYKRVIVLEDDLLTSKYFLKYLNEGLAFYEDYKNIFTVCGWSFPETIMKIPKKYSSDVYFTHRNNSYGWGTWHDRWEKADWDVEDYGQFMRNKKYQKLFNEFGDDLTDMLKSQMTGKIDSWSIRWTYAHFKHNAFAVCPTFSFIDNIGFDGSGIHSKNDDKFKNNLIKAKENITFTPPFLDKKIVSLLKKIYRYKLITKFRLYVHDQFSSNV